MRVFICGMDGYLGWSLACHLAQSGHEVSGMDAGLRRQWVREVGSDSAIPISPFVVRCDAHIEHWDSPGGEVLAYCVGEIPGNITDYAGLKRALEISKPDAIVHLAEMPSAPYSMIDAEHAAFTHSNNVIGSLNLLWVMREACPDAHLIKLGTMGEYGTPKCDIPEGVFPEGSYWGMALENGQKLRCRGDLSGLMFPRSAGSWYHQTKVHDTHNTAFACKIWGLSATDIMQGVVYGTRIDAFGDDPRLRTRFDFDECFGTAINRFCAQAIIGHPLTVYGKGGQTRGYLPLRDSMQCLTLAIENPAAKGQYRTLNQFDRTYSVLELAEAVHTVAAGMGIKAEIRHYDNPRVELEEHAYKPDHQGLFDLGYQPAGDLRGQIAEILTDLAPNANRIAAHSACIAPRTQWTKKEPKYAI